MARNIILLGCRGQLGRELLESAEGLPDHLKPTALGRDQLDVTDAAGVRDYLTAARPHTIINAAAYTAVDRAETDADAAHAVNDVAPGHLAATAAAIGARLIHVSTDFVFRGDSSRPYLESDATEPMSVYGRSKLAGEERVRAGTANHVIIRTAWLYSVHGNNFVKTMLRLMAERERLTVVADQVGTPCHANGLARTIWEIVAQTTLNGTYHWTDDGQASWYEFAVAIQRLGLELGLLDRDIPIEPVAAATYPTAARRPAYSVLSKAAIQRDLGIAPKPWRDELEAMLRALAKSSA